jgi:hypothetical protein
MMILLIHKVYVPFDHPVMEIMIVMLVLSELVPELVHKIQPYLVQLYEMQHSVNQIDVTGMQLLFVFFVMLHLHHQLVPFDHPVMEIMIVMLVLSELVPELVHKIQPYLVQLYEMQHSVNQIDVTGMQLLFVFFVMLHLHHQLVPFDHPVMEIMIVMLVLSELVPELVHKIQPYLVQLYEMQHSVNQIDVTGMQLLFVFFVMLYHQHILGNQNDGQNVINYVDDERK